ncbi:pilus assembly PilX family protein [Acinetobacter pseudolwoffii]|uniref:pilus assembly PilX family protein n=1 Tax=Acinetobacter pseudolwoffii TaxID=2053287 RepID=UPI003FD8D275
MKKQQGSVLIITVVVLFAATMISLYAMRGTISQDKMTANINNKLITTNAAEDGATQFLNWLNGQFKGLGGGWPTGTTKQNWNTSAGIPNTNLGELTVNSGNNGYYWIDSSKHPAGCASNPCWDDTNKIVTVKVTGNLIKTSGSTTTILGESTYQIKIKGQFPGAVKLPDLPAALTLGGTVGSFTGKNSNNFKIDGQNKLAIATMSSSASTVLNGIPNNRRDSDHYSGGADCPNGSGACVKNTDLGIWGDANKVMALVESIKASSGVTYIDGSVSGSLANSVPSCAGIVIIHGNYSPNGNQCDFKGVLLILGEFNGNGGGNTAIRGGIYVANIQGSSPGAYTFGNSSMNLNGGGNMSVTYDASFLGGDPNNPFAGGGPIKTTVLAWNDIL